MPPDDLARVKLEQGDITDFAALERVLDEHEITRVVHLAAMQVPFCRADPVLGARVNVVGTVNVFEAVKRRRDRIPGVAWASSAAVYSAARPDAAPETGGLGRRRTTASTSSRTRARRGSTGRTTACRRSGSGSTSSTGPVATRG